MWIAITDIVKSICHTICTIVDRWTLHFYFFVHMLSSSAALFSSTGTACTVPIHQNLALGPKEVTSLSSAVIELGLLESTKNGTAFSISYGLNFSSDLCLAFQPRLQRREIGTIESTYITSFFLEGGREWGRAGALSPHCYLPTVVNFALNLHLHQNLNIIIISHLLWNWIILYSFIIIIIVMITLNLCNQYIIISLYIWVQYSLRIWKYLLPIPKAYTKLQ